MFTHTDVPGLPDGTVTVPVPASCPELADLYNAPSCAYDHELVYIPMQMDLYLAETGGELWWVLIPVAWALIALGVTVVLSVFLTGAKKLDPKRAEDDRA